MKSNPKSKTPSTTPKKASALIAIIGIQAFSLPAVPAHSDSLRTLLVGGGPYPAKNQVAIESNVRYLTRLLPENAKTTTLFADGDLKSATVLFTPAQSDAEAVLNLLYPRQQGRRGGGSAGSPPAGPPAGFGTPSASNTSETDNQTSGNPTRVVSALTRTPSPPPARAATPPGGKFAVPQLTSLDGSATRNQIETAFNGLSQAGKSSEPYFLYFTGHGNGSPENRENNYYALWNDDKFTVQDLSRQIATLPKKEPVVLVMVQCYSGSFANVLFDGGDPKADLVDRDVVGFFAATKDRTAAGCTPSINEEYYYDFTSYFFSALTGRDRLNRPFEGAADYNKDGKIGLDEAFYWSVIYDKSIDVPVATSDVFLERFAPLEGDSWQDTPYSSLQQWASPAQKVVLDELSKVLELSGESRIRDAQKLDVEKLGGRNGDKAREIEQRVRTVREASLPALQVQFPDLADRNAPGYNEVRAKALAQIEKEVGEGKWKELLDLNKERAQARNLVTDSTVYTAKRLRFLRISQKVVQDHALRSSKNGSIKKRYFRLLNSEAKTLLPYRDTRLARVSDEVWKP